MTKDEALKLAAEMERGQFSTTLLPAAAELRRLHEENRKLRAQLALDKKAENARELGLDYEPEQKPKRCSLCNYQHGHAIGCANNPVDIAIQALAQPEQRNVTEQEHDVLMNSIKASSTVVSKGFLAQPEPWEKFCDSNCVWTDHHPDCKLAQQEQKPVAKVVSTAPERIWLDLGFDPTDEDDISFHDLVDATWSEDNATGYGIEYVRADTTPPQRTWVGLTDKEAMQICVDCGCLSEDWLTLLDAIESKLKEKNDL